jgi:DNA polymerase-1
VCISWWWDGKAHAARASDKLFKYIQDRIDEADVVLGFNLKFDYHWLRSVGIRLDNARVYDCQVAEYVLERQQKRYPSLDESCAKYNLGQKLDIIKTEYWDKGINTDAIPWEVLREYAAQDALLTYQLYQAQQQYITPSYRRLLSLMFQDLHVLADMEFNGLKYDDLKCAERGAELDDKISEITQELTAVYPDVPINFGSNDHLSAFLYGGTVKETVKEHVGFFKTGKQAGLPKYRNVEVEHALPQMVKPIRGSELAKEGFYGTSEDVLKKLKGPRKAKRCIELILELSKMEKLNGTYYRGIPALNEKMNWPKGMIHGNFNQVTTATGRLSSNRPNLQNFASSLQDIFITRY